MSSIGARGPALHDSFFVLALVVYLFAAIVGLTMSTVWVVRKAY